jgi:hypothetical protein
MATIIIVCGGRTYADRAFLETALDALHRKHPSLIVITGGARGADTLAHEWALSHAMACDVIEADWQRDGKAAGPRRNQAMLSRILHHRQAEGATIGVVAFPGGTGTAHMVKIARAAGVSVWQPKPAKPAVTTT